MFYAKKKLPNGRTIKTELTGANVFNRCPDCGREIAVDIERLLRDEESDLLSTAVLCPECARKYHIDCGDSVDNEAPCNYEAAGTTSDKPADMIFRQRLNMARDFARIVGIPLDIACARALANAERLTGEDYSQWISLLLDDGYGTDWEV